MDTAKKDEKKHKIKIVFILFIAFTVLLGIGNTIQRELVNSTAKKLAKSENESSLSSLIDAYQLAISSKIDGYINELNLYTLSTAAETGNIQTMRTWMNTKSAGSKSFDYMLVCGKDGIFYTDIGTTGNILDRSYYKAIFQQGKDYYIDTPTPSKVSGEMVCHITKAVKVRGETVALFAGVLKVDSLMNLLKDIDLGKTGFCCMITDDKTIIHHPLEENFSKANVLTEYEKGNKEVLSAIDSLLQGNSGLSWIKTETGKKELLLYKPISNAPLNLLFSIEEEQVYVISNSIQSTLVISGLIVFILVLLLTLQVTVTSLKPLQLVEKTINGIATGNADLTQRLNVSTRTEVSSIVQGFNTFIKKLQDIISDVKTSKELLEEADDELQKNTSDTVSAIEQIQSSIDSVHNQMTNQAASVEETAGAVHQIASNIASLENMIETQASGVVEASAAIEEMVGNIDSVNQVVEKMVNSFAILQNTVATGVDKQNNANERIELIKQQSEMLSEANTTIADIASQTNLLAMNAAIEAAHAGESGKGFSVVADEIRKLSETSSEQSKTIGSQLSNIHGIISDVVEATAASSTSFNAVSKEINETDQLVRQIKEAMTEQHEGSKQISEALSSMNDSTIEVKTASAEMNAGNQAILEEIKTLQDTTTVIRDSIKEMKVGSEQIVKSGVSLKDISVKMKSSIAKIGNQIDQFTV
ncbi:MAG: HAMP domain-containing protein [Treponema sp.]|nr:HAMP domain-containing protein [Treponema sp.]